MAGRKPNRQHHEYGCAKPDNDMSAESGGLLPRFAFKPYYAAGKKA
jgi:hypothetical protein